MIQDKRCVHLDFHTSEKIKGIGADFKREEFAAALKEANLDSITVFAKCHHGNLYYHSDKYFTHPHLTVPLLEEQLAACKEAGVSAKIYISAGFDEHSAMEHPEWLQVTSDGTHPNLLMPGFKRLCFNTPYLDV
ncbi:MAG: beta-galactosidase, partial [Clostridia bacterium]|nr:beta-galactosidase [Clostridia bacterium]